MGIDTRNASLGAQCQASFLVTWYLKAFEAGCIEEVQLYDEFPVDSAGFTVLLYKLLKLATKNLKIKNLLALDFKISTVL